MLMTGTRVNAREIYAEMMKAVALLLAGNPDPIRRPSLVDEFNTIDLGRGSQRTSRLVGYLRRSGA
jgi:hypothetical protein